MTGREVEPYRGEIEIADPVLGNWPAEQQPIARPVNVTVEAPSAGAVAVAAMVRAVASIPLAVALGAAVTIDAFAGWAERAIPRATDRVAVLFGAAVVVLVELAMLAMLASARVNLVVFGLLALGLGMVGAAHRTGGLR